VKLISIPIRLIREALAGFIADNCMRMAAALSYYAVFSLPSLLAIAIKVVALFIRARDVRGQVGKQLVDVMGQPGAQQLEVLLTAARNPNQGWGNSIVGTCLLLVAATGVLVELQAALNEAWKAKPVRTGLKDFLIKRLLSLVMVLMIAALLLVSLGLNTTLAAFGSQIKDWLPGWIARWLLGWTHLLATFTLLALLFAAMFKFIPDIRIQWRDVWLGAVATAVLFMVGNSLIGLYLAHSNPASAYGAAGSVALILIWIYYAAMTVLFGAEFTHAWAQRRKATAPPQ
jgi:membrane protein